MQTAIDHTAFTNTILDTLSANSDIRQQAKHQLAETALPHNKHEEYKFTPLTKTLEKNFNFSKKNELSTITSIEEFLIPELNADRLVFINGEFSESLSDIRNKNISIRAVQDSDLKNSPLVNTTDAFVMWNTAAFQSGVCIEVGKNINAERPVIFHYIHDTTKGEVKSFIRNVIHIAAKGELTLIEKFDSISTTPNFSNTVTEAVVEEEGKLNFYSIQADNGQRHQFGQIHVEQASNSLVNCYTFTLDGAFVRNNLTIALDGEQCEAHMNGLYLLHGKTLADNHTVVDHRKPNSFSNELYKGVMEDQSKGVFNGKIFVRPNAQKTNAFQSNRNILLSDSATVNTKPQLEIWADDVKCSHGCTSGQLDEEALFYLQSRGIGIDTARAMMLYAFAGEVLETINDDVLKSYVDSLISERLHKNF